MAIRILHYRGLVTTIHPVRNGTVLRPAADQNRSWAGRALNSLLELLDQFEWTPA
jgi:hypothetical protein